MRLKRYVGGSRGALVSSLSAGCFANPEYPASSRQHRNNLRRLYGRFLRSVRARCQGGRRGFKSRSSLGRGVVVAHPPFPTITPYVLTGIEFTSHLPTIRKFGRQDGRPVTFHTSRRDGIVKTILGIKGGGKSSRWQVHSQILSGKTKKPSWPSWAWCSFLPG